AAASYRRVEVADLDTCRLTELFAPASYDFILCADVLEHIRHGERVLAECKTLLAEGGRALLSIPNAGYTGLVAELMAGEFRYRPEGLLDETHLRFFTRRALLRFLHGNGWVAEQVETVQRPLPDSEFHVAFDALPPAVARHLLALPDALTYQFIVTTRPLAASEAPLPVPDEAPPPLLDAAAPLPTQALFTSELHLGRDGVFDEQHKITRPGVIGQTPQTLHFPLPGDETLTHLRLDPADRPGYLYLHDITLSAADGRALWHWSAADTLTLASARMNGVLSQPPATPAGAFVLLLHGSDPWIELPIPAGTVAQARGGVLDVQLGWPMSADYLALAGAAQTAAAARLELSRQLSEQTRLTAQERDSRQLLEQQHTQERDAGERLKQQNRHLRMQKQALLEQQAILSRERDEARQLVHEIENSTVFRTTRPIVHAKMWFDRLLGIGSARPPQPQAQRPAEQPATPQDHPVDIIVPVYRGLEDTRRCLESVLASPCRTPWRLIVIDDASPEPELSAWLRGFASTDNRITLLNNEENLGFVATVNRGMALSEHNDVLLLNSDTEVAPGWLDRIRAAAYSDRQIATVTPFSNNATICSYPRFCKNNDLPAGWDTARLDALFARVNAGQSVDVPTGVGFCLYIRRAALHAIGLFDVERFGKGYGEENDFCIRAATAGWRNLHALDTFVRHFGGLSFGASKSARERDAMKTLRQLHPRYEAGVLRFVQADPARPARTAVDIARLQADPGPLILAVLHDRDGGTERHVIELAALQHGRARILILRPLPGQRLSLRLPDAGENFEFVFALPEQGDALLTLLRRLGVQHMHFHHLLGHGEFVRQLPARLGTHYDFTAHDFYTLCPQITLTGRGDHYCGEQGEQQCTECLAHRPAPGGVNIIHWRSQGAELLSNARYVIAPARDILRRLISLAPGAPLKLVPHTDIDPAQPLPEPAPARIHDNRPLRVAVIGALSTIKGADMLEDVAVAARKQGAPVEFHLLGFAYSALRTQPRARLTVHGRYNDPDLPDLLRWLQPDLVWFPALWPETYSYTLSACLQGGWPVAAPNLGAFAERLAERPWSWVLPWQQSAQDWLDFFTGLRQNHYRTGQPPAVPPALADLPALACTRGFNPEPPAWYTGPYLDGLPAAAAETITVADLAAHQPTPSPGIVTGAKGSALGLLARLRTQPLLRPLARAIPAHWQTRMKNWLVK
ncbi:MAG: glycosyltransferase, partial [Burkholderiaceae bacterium]|nr:glycosyltransferase [Burkholderiaceae bacterium]